MHLLVTGGAGFIGSNFIRYMLNARNDVQISNLDKLTYIGDLNKLKAIENLSNYRFYRKDVSKYSQVKSVFQRSCRAFGSYPDVVVHFAAETHVDRSLEEPMSFVRTNVLGTSVMLECAKKFEVKRYIQISTDEVYGALGQTGRFVEKDSLNPNNPYAASKASAELIVQTYHKNYGLPTVITRCSNNYGPYQHPEKLIPLMIANALENKPLPVYGNGLNVRDWIYVEDHCRAIEQVIESGISGQIYNVAANAEMTNLEVVKTLLHLLGKPHSLIRYFPDRQNHDWRYALDTTKITQELGWRRKWDFEKGIKVTIDWYLANGEWLNQARSGVYDDYYQRMYDRHAIRSDVRHDSPNLA